MPKKAVSKNRKKTSRLKAKIKRKQVRRRRAASGQKARKFS